MNDRPCHADSTPDDTDELEYQAEVDAGGMEPEPASTLVTELNQHCSGHHVHKTYVGAQPWKCVFKKAADRIEADAKRIAELKAPLTDELGTSMVAELESASTDLEGLEHRASRLLKAVIKSRYRWMRNAKADRDELAALKADTYCAYCGHRESSDVDGDVIAEHIRTCPDHPMRAVEDERDVYRSKYNIEVPLREYAEAERDRLREAVAGLVPFVGHAHLCQFAVEGPVTCRCGAQAAVDAVNTALNRTNAEADS